MTVSLCRDDAYLKSCPARVVAITGRGGIILDQTVFYATGGGQPGDCGTLKLADGRTIAIATAVYGDDRRDVVHVPARADDVLPQLGDEVVCGLDWERRHAHMRIHTALHLLSAILPYPVTGGQIAADGGRLDFDIPDANFADKQEIEDKLNALIAGDHAVTFEWISDEELEANPGLVKTMAVKPPTGAGRVRLMRIGADVDLQPCGGTHVKSTGEIGRVAVGKIEKKGAKNRRVRIGFA